jgi:membrane protein DedA with SNARE-associated domain
MEFLPDQETLTFWMTHYGSIAIFILLALGIIALPVPDETLLVLAGIFMKKGDMHVISTLLGAYGGALTGITFSYLLGRTAGAHIIQKFGSYVGITHEKLQKVHDWFEHYGKWTLSFGYFIPGVRHLTGFAAGISGLEYPSFALFAYTGALVWVTTFISIGYFLGEYWYTIVALGEAISDRLVFITVAFIVVVYILWRQYNKKSSTN